MNLNLRKPALTLGTLLLSCSVALGAKYKVFTVSGDWNGSQGCTITAGVDTLTVNFGAGKAADCAEELKAAAAGSNFTITRRGTEVTICHPGYTPIIRKVNIAGVPAGAIVDDAAFESNLLLAVTGQAVGGEAVGVMIDGFLVMIRTKFGQTAEQVADTLSAELDFFTPPDDPWFAYGVEFNVMNSKFGPIDLGIWSLGPLDLSRAQVLSTDPGIGIEIVQPCRPVEATRLR